MDYEEYSNDDYKEYDEDEEVDDYGDDNGEEYDESKYESAEEDEMYRYKDDEEDEFIEGNGGAYIDSGAEWRDFRDSGDVSKSRVGMARDTSLDDDLSLAFNIDFKHLELLSKTPEDIYKALCLETISKYGLEKNLYDMALKVLKKLKDRGIRIKYKNPKMIIFSIMSFKNGSIDNELLEKSLSNFSSDDKVKKIDLVRYCFLIEKLGIF